MVKGAADNPNGNANATPTGYYMRKYIPENILAANHVGNNYRNWAIIRYAEILLNYAEAMNEVSGPCQEVYSALNLIRHRAGITGNVEDRSDLTSSKDRMRNFIRKERTVELAFEEHRPWDVRRWNVAKEALSRPIYGIDVDAQGNITRKVHRHVYLKNGCICIRYLKESIGKRVLKITPVGNSLNRELYENKKYEDK